MNDEELEELEAVCRPSFSSSLLLSPPRRPPYSRIKTISPPRNTLLQPITNAKSSEIAQKRGNKKNGAAFLQNAPTRPVSAVGALDLSWTSEEEPSEEESSEEEVEIVAHRRERREGRDVLDRPVIAAFLGDAPLSNASLAPLDRPSQANLAHRERRIAEKRGEEEKAGTTYPCRPPALFQQIGNCSTTRVSPKRVKGQRTIGDYYRITKRKKRKREREEEVKKAVIPPFDVVSMSKASNRALLRIIRPFEGHYDYLREKEEGETEEFESLKDVNWNSIFSKRKYVAALINPPWHEIEEVGEYLKEIEEMAKRIEEGGLLFFFVDENHFIAPVVRLCSLWSFSFVDSLSCVLKTVSNKFWTHRPNNQAVCKQSKLNCLIFRKPGSLPIRHQRNPDVCFYVHKPWLKHHSRPYDHVYEMIETLLPFDSANPHFIELWARPNIRRKLWTMIQIGEEGSVDAEEPWCNDTRQKEKATPIGSPLTASQPHESPSYDSDLHETLVTGMFQVEGYSSESEEGDETEK